MKAKYIDKTFPITLQDLIDLANSENQDPKDLKLILNEHNPYYTGYAQCALLNQDCDKISIELYQTSDGTPELLQLKQPTNTQNKPLTESDEHYQKELLALVEEMESDGLSYATIVSILKSGSKGYI